MSKQQRRDHKPPPEPVRATLRVTEQPDGAWRSKDHEHSQPNDAETTGRQ
jgi:hypothetical protein